MVSIKSRSEQVKNATILFAFLFVVWGFYRFLFQLPEEIEELIIKPIIWLVPVFYLLKKEKAGLATLGFTSNKLFSALYFSLGLGVAFAVVGMLVNYLKYGGFDFSANIGDKFVLTSLGLSFATAISEETAFRGYIFTRIESGLGSEIWANLITSVLWALVHLPITIFVWQLNFAAATTFLLLTLIFGVGSSFIFAKTRNIAAPILLHVLWSWPIILFR